MKQLKHIVKLIVLVTGVIITLLLSAGFFYNPDFSIPKNLKGQHIIINGMKIRYFQVGNGPDIVFLHGGMGSVEDFDPLYNELKSRYRITAFDRPGMGYSEIKNNSYTLESTASIIEQMIQKLNLKNPVIFGHSHGGAIALNLAVKNAKGIKGYMLLAPAAYYYDRYRDINDSVPMKLLRIPGLNTGIAMSVGPIIGDRMIEETLTRMMAGNQGFPGDFLSFRQKLWNKPVSTITRARQMHSFCSDIKIISAQYSSIKSPVLIIVGTKDSQDIQESAARISREVKKSQLVTIKNGGHYAQFDSTKDLVKAVDIFMEKIIF